MDREPWFLASMLGPVASIYFVFAALLIPFILYVIARWRSHREAVADPQLGLKVAMGYFASTGFQIGCGATALLVYAMIGDLGDDRGSVARVAFGLLIPSAVIFVAHLVMLSKTNHDQFPAVQRMFLGYNLLITGTIGFVGLILGCEAIFKSGSAGELGKIAGALSLVYCTAWVIIGMRLSAASNRFELPAPAPPTPPAS